MTHAATPTPGEVQRQYLRILKGDRTQEAFARVLGVKRAAVAMILSGERKVMPEHLDRVSEAWQLAPSRMFADMARIAMNLELGLPAAEGIGGRVISEASAPAPSPQRPRSA